MTKVLIIDDNNMHRLIHRKWIEAICPDYEVIEAENAEAGVKIIIEESPSCVLLDYFMLGEDGFQTLHKLKHDLANCPPIIFLTCALTEELKRNVMALGAEACFDKSTVEGPDLVQAIITAVHKR